MASKGDGKRLGRGLEALFGDNVGDVLEQIQNGEKTDIPTQKSTVSVDEVRPNPYQPRTVFNEEKLNELAQSIKEHGVFTPIIVRKSISGYDLIAGERRLRASKIAGLKEIPAMIVDFSEEQMMEIALLENIQREDLSVIEEALGYQNLIEKLNYTQEELANRVGKSRTYITNTLRLLNLPKDVQEMVKNNEIQMGHVRALLPLEDKKLISKTAIKIANEGLSVRAVEKLVKDLLNPKVKEPKKPVKTDYSYGEKLISDYLHTKVTINEHQISIKFSDNEELNRILEVMGLIED